MLQNYAESIRRDLVKISLNGMVRILENSDIKINPSDVQN
jgi:hypothetical protein